MFDIVGEMSREYFVLADFRVAALAPFRGFGQTLNFAPKPNLLHLK